MYCSTDVAVPARAASPRAERAAPVVHDDAATRLHVVRQQPRDAVVHVLAAQRVVARGADDGEGARGVVEDGHVERADAHAKDEHVVRVGPRGEAGRERRGRGLEQRARDGHARALKRVERRRALRVPELGGHGDGGLERARRLAQRAARRRQQRAREHAARGRGRL